MFTDIIIQQVLLFIFEFSDPTSAIKNIGAEQNF